MISKYNELLSRLALYDSLTKDTKACFGELVLVQTTDASHGECAYLLVGCLELKKMDRQYRT
jgi:hypothetical protein